MVVEVDELVELVEVDVVVVGSSVVGHPVLPMHKASLANGPSQKLGKAIASASVICKQSCPASYTPLHRGLKHHQGSAVVELVEVDVVEVVVEVVLVLVELVDVELVVGSPVVVSEQFTVIVVNVQSPGGVKSGASQPHDPKQPFDTTVHSVSVSSACNIQLVPQGSGVEVEVVEVVDEVDEVPGSAVVVHIGSSSLPPNSHPVGGTQVAGLHLTVFVEPHSPQEPVGAGPGTQFGRLKPRPIQSLQSAQLPQSSQHPPPM